MSKHNDKYEEVEVLRDPDGVVCVINRRVGTELLSFMLCKEFERDGQIVRTSFLSRRHTAALKRIIPRIEEWLDREVDRASVRAATR